MPFTNRPTAIEVLVDQINLQIYLPRKKYNLYLGDTIKELSTFATYGLFTSDEFQIEKLVNMQHKFKKWFRRQHQFDPTGGNLWGLQPAILATYGEFLDKTETLNIWSRGLGQPNQYNNAKIQSMICYAVNDCLAVTKLAHTIFCFFYLIKK
ncbi:unnamed protein product [Rotaria magnacalcarata]|uniref:Uncharacterized protein n=1 Tax=Rotaria magnacalcarata TaxID=392030 RepID=A0A8S3IR79_9BILA|nr:unnamed protein product [Rotaria magnacalcarata]